MTCSKRELASCPVVTCLPLHAFLPTPLQAVRDQVYAELQDRMHTLTKERDASRDAAAAADSQVRARACLALA